MANPSADVEYLVGQRIEALEGEMGSPFWNPSIQFWDDFMTNKIQEGGGDQIYVPIETQAPTATFSSSYKVSLTAGQDIVITNRLTFNYEWLTEEITVYKQEVALAKNRGGGKQVADIIDLRIKNAGKSFMDKLNVGAFTGDADAATEMAGFPSFWEGNGNDATYGGLTRTTYASRLDASSATLKTAGGNGTKFTDATAADGTAILDALYEMYYACSNTGDMIDWIFIDPINFGKIRRKVADNQVININESNKFGGSTGKPPAQGLMFEGAKIVSISSGYLTRGECFGINSNYVQLATVDGYSPNKMRPIGSVPVSTAPGATSIHFQAGLKLITNAPTKHFWATQLGMA